MPAVCGRLLLGMCLGLAPGPAARGVETTAPLGSSLPPGAVARLGTPQRDGGAGVLGLAFSPDGKRLAAAAGARVSQWDLASGKEVLSYQGTPGSFEARSVAYSPDGQTLAVAGDGYIRRWETATGAGVRLLRGPPAGTVTWIGYAPDGQTLAVTAGRLISLYDLARGDRLRQHPASHPVPQLAFFPDGKTVAVGSGPNTGADGIRVLEVVTGNTAALWKATNPYGPVQALALTADGKTLAAALATHIDLWDTATGTRRTVLEPLGVPNGQRGVSASWSVAFAPDGKTLAAAGPDGALHLWEVATGGSVRHVGAPATRLLSVAFSPSGRTLATGCSDGTILLWGLFGRRGAEAGTREEQWADLADADAARAYRVMTALAATPEPTVAWLRGRLTPVAAPDDKRLARLIADLDSDHFQVREEAAGELGLLGPVAEAALRQTLKGAPSAEVKRRIERLLAGRDAQVLARQRRQERVVQVLEYLGTVAAREMLMGLAGGTPRAPLTQDAAAALKRLAHRSPVDR